MTRYVCIIQDSYAKLKKTYIIFICDYDPFGEGYLQYNFRTRCDQKVDIVFKDETVKIVLNTKGKIGEIPEELRAFLTYITSNQKSTRFVEEVEEAVNQVKHNEEWRSRYMTLEERMEQIKEDSLAKGEKKGIKKGERKIIQQMIVHLKETMDSNEEIVNTIVKTVGFSKEEAEKWLKKCDENDSVK